MAAENQKKNTEVKAVARYIHHSPRKLRLVSNLIQKHSVDEALQQLKFSPKKAAFPIIKVLNSAVANAVHNFDLNREQLYIKSLTVDAGPVIKKSFPRAQGRAFIVRKRTSHINILLESKAAPKKSRRSIFSARPVTVKKPEAEEVKQTLPAEVIEKSEKIETQKPRIKPEPKSSEKMKSNLISLKRRLFNRKSGQ